MSAMNFVQELTEQKIAAAIDYASSHGVKVINSWGSDSAGRTIRKRTTRITLHRVALSSLQSTPPSIGAA